MYAYISRYTHRTAISNHRLVRYENGQVTFRARDNDHPGRYRLITVKAIEFIRRFLNHVLPKGFVRIRHYGLLASRNVGTKLEQARALIQPALSVAKSEPEASSSNWRDIMYEVTGVDLSSCPYCKHGRIVRMPLIPSVSIQLKTTCEVFYMDSS